MLLINRRKNPLTYLLSLSLSLSPDLHPKRESLVGRKIHLWGFFDLQTQIQEKVFVGDNAGVKIDGFCVIPKMVLALLLILLFLAITLSSTLGSSLSPEISPVIWMVTPFRLISAPASSPGYHASLAGPPLSMHHQEKVPAISPASFIPPQDRECAACSVPLTESPIGSPCGCVLPIEVVIDVEVYFYVIFNLVQELEVDVASGTFLKQSQVKIFSATSSRRGEEWTEVTLHLVPLGENFDKITALLIHDRFWQKKVQINRSLFHEYEVIYVHYPGLSFSPLSSDGGISGSGPSEAASHQYPLSANVPAGKTHMMNARIIVVVVALFSCIVVFACLGLAIFVLKSLKNGHQTIDSTLATPSITKRSGLRSIIPSSLASSTTMSFISTIATCPISIRTFSLTELKIATDDFSSERKLGEGWSSFVYHGILDGTDVAVKLLKRVDENRDPESEFVSEVEMLSRLHHRNLVKLIGICIEGHRRCLVYELVPKGSVESHLHGADKGKEPMDWDARMKIALGSARALAYLHEDSNPCVIHRDFKPSNILLEDDFTPKVSDFGLAKVASEGSHVSTRVMGTFGYVAPEYAMTGHLLIKSDVYSYGVVLLELLSGRKPVHLSGLQDPENLVVWARPLLGSREGLEQLVDPYLRVHCDFDNLARVASIASMCVHGEPSQRPFMGEVVQALKLICSGKEEEACEDSYTQNESYFFGPDYEVKGDFFHESSWSNGASTPLAYGPFVNMEYSSGSMEEMKADPKARYSQSCPLRTKRKKREFYRLMRGSVSEHGHPSQHGFNF